MSDGKNLHKAKEAKQDEFYTQLEDIENELRHYKEHFKGKTVFCNCDDPYESNFFKYFAMNFNHLGLKKLITTCYVSSPIMYTQLSLFDDMEQSFSKPADPNKKPYKVEITEVTDENGDGAFDLDDIKHLLKNKKNVCSVLKGNGDFRSDECIELLKEADIVVTNPPFSLFREFVSLLFRYNKDFVILGNKTAVTMKEIFPYIQTNRMWIGMTPMSREMYFDVPKAHADYLVTQQRNRSIVLHNGRMMARAGAIWYTTLDIEKRHEEMILYRSYAPSVYPKYDNYDAIEVSKTTDIPFDYYEIMGVPITFLDKYNPDQFEILGCTQRGCHELVPDTKKYDDYWEMKQDGTRTKSSGSKTNENGNLAMNDGKHNYFINDKGQIVQSTYSRIFIRRKGRQNED